MLRTYQAEIDENYVVRFLEPAKLTKKCRVLVTFLDQETLVSTTALLSEAALADDWLRPEEEAAWAHLKDLPSL